MRCPSTFPLDWLLIFLKLTAEDRKPRIKSKLAHLMSQNWTHLSEHFQSKLCKFILNPSVRHLGYLSRTHYTPDISNSMAILIRWPLTTSRGKERFSEIKIIQIIEDSSCDHMNKYERYSNITAEWETSLSNSYSSKMSLSWHVKGLCDWNWCWKLSWVWGKFPFLQRPYLLTKILKSRLPHLHHTFFSVCERLR